MVFDILDMFWQHVLQLKVGYSCKGPVIVCLPTLYSEVVLTHVFSGLQIEVSAGPQN